MSNYVTTHASEMRVHEEACFCVYNEGNSYIEMKQHTNKQAISLHQTDLKATRTQELTRS
jgi:hypothetical protein